MAVLRLWRLVGNLALAITLLVSCHESRGTREGSIRAWLRAAAGINETPELIECTQAAMEAELSDDEIREWLSHDPETITVEEIQALPHAIDVVDRCRHLLPPEP